MTFLLMQTFLLLAAAYFLGAFIGCAAKRIVAPEQPVAPAVVTRTREAIVEATPIPIPIPATRPISMPAPMPPPVAPRRIEPVQPKIDVLHRPVRAPDPMIETGTRPAPRTIFVNIDPSRFERALFGPDPNEGMPRIAILELRPASIESPTGPPQPWPPAPKQTMIEEPDLVDESPPSAEDMPEQARLQTAATSEPSLPAGAATVSAAAAAIAAARAAVSNVASAMMGRRSRTATRTEDADAPVGTPGTVIAEPSGPAEPPRATQPESAPVERETSVLPAPQKSRLLGDDLQRIRAVDADTELRLNALGVSTFDDIAGWTSSDIARIADALGLNNRIDREQWIEQAQILAKGGETYYSRNRAAALRSKAEERRSDAPPIAAPPVAAPAVEQLQPQDERVPPLEPDRQSDARKTLAEPELQPAPELEPAKVAGEQEPDTSLSPQDEHQASQADDVEESNALRATDDEPPPSAPVGMSAASAAAAAAGFAGAHASAPQSRLEGSPARAALEQRSVAEMAAAAATAIAAASASVTRGIRPIEPRSPLSTVDPNIQIPARLTDAIREKEAQAAARRPSPPELEIVPDEDVAVDADADDLKRIRGIGVLIEKRLNALGFTRYEHVANWSSADIDRVSQILDFKGRIERENWVEQARILASGGQTEFSRRVDRGDVET